MKVKELIEKLKTFPEDNLVVVNGYEGGFSDVDLVKALKVKLNVNPESYNGPHDDAKDADTNVVLIQRRENSDN